MTSAAEGPRAMTTNAARTLGSVEARLLRGEEIVLFGPRGIGKTTWGADLAARFRRQGIAVGTSTSTKTLHDVVDAVERAYPSTSLCGLAARRKRGRLRLAAEAHPAILLLDHVENVTAPMRTFLRGLRGKGIGIAFFVDVDADRDRHRVRQYRLTHHEIAVPRLHGNAIGRLLTTHLGPERLPGDLRPADRARLVAAALGRPGWIEEAAARLRDARYWSSGRPRIGLVCTDVQAELLGRYLRGTNGGWR